MTNIITETFLFGNATCIVPRVGQLIMFLMVESADPARVLLLIYYSYSARRRSTVHSQDKLTKTLFVAIYFL
jgi:hypothetical protein